MEIIVSYKTSAFCQCGWRSVIATAKVEKISDKRLRILEIVDVDGNGNSGYASRTGAKRQSYSVSSIAHRESGKIKNLSSVKIIE